MAQEDLLSSSTYGEAQSQEAFNEPVQENVIWRPGDRELKAN